MTTFTLLPAGGETRRVSRASHEALPEVSWGRRFVTWMLVIAALVTLGVAVQQHYRVTLKLQDPLGGHINDFDRWMIMAPRFLHDRVDYVNDRFPTPPLSLMALAPFTALSRPAAQFAWVCLKLPLACLVLLLSAGIVSRSGARLTPSAMALIVACWWLPVDPRHAGRADEFPRAPAAW